MGSDVSSDARNTRNRDSGCRSRRHEGGRSCGRSTISGNIHLDRGLDWNGGRGRGRRGRESGTNRCRHLAQRIALRLPVLPVLLVLQMERLRSSLERA